MRDKFLHPDYQNMQSRWTMCRDAAAGEYEVHNKGELYLPRLEQETDKSYQLRLSMTPFFGATWRTIITLRGMMFRKEPTIEIPDAMQDDLSNIDYAGQSLTSFAQDVSMQALTVGRSGVLVDYSSVPDGVTEADARNAGSRSFMRLYNAESILNWQYRNDRGMKVLSMVRLLEDASNYDDIELEPSDEIHKVLMLNGNIYQQLIYKVDGQGNENLIQDITPRMQGSTLDFIPFQPIGADSLDMRVEIPPLIDLITTNFHHYRQSSSYERGCFISGLPTANIFGEPNADRNIYVGGTMANVFSDPNARFEYAEVSSEFGGLLKNLEKKEYQMAVLGARMLESQRAGVESEGALARKQSGEESVLADISTTISQGMTQALKWFADWQGYESKDISFQLTKDFLPFAMDAQEITALFSAYLGKGLSYDALYYNYKRAGLYPPGTTIDEERGKINEGVPGMV